MTQRFQLSNGLTLLTEELRYAPVVALQAWVRAGSADESDEEAGVAHLHEHMLFKGTPRRGLGEIARDVEAAGGEINAWTSFDETVYHVVMASSELSSGLDILADALRNSAFDPGELESEVEVVVEEIRRGKDLPSRRISDALFALAFRSHPYRRPIIGSEQTVRSLTRDRILGFYQRHYQPERLTLVAVGDFETERLREQAETYFADWHADKTEARPARPVEPEQRETRVRVLLEDVKESRLALTWHIPSARHQDIPAVDVLSVVLGHGDSSRLYLQARQRRELVNDVHAYAYTPRDPGLLLAGAGLRAEKMEEALGTILDEVYRLRERLVPAEELEKAKIIILSESAYQRETVQGEARKIGFFEVVAGDFSHEERYLSALRELTPQGLREVARKYLGPNPAVVLQVPTETTCCDEAATQDVVRTRFAKAKGGRSRKVKPGSLGVRRVQLDNGAVLLVAEQDSPVVAIRAVALGGLRWERPESLGLGNLTSCLFGLASESLAAEELSARVAKLGGSLSGFSGRNSLGLRAEFIRETADEGLDLFCDALLHPRFSEAELNRERAVVLERIASREDNPAGMSYDAFAEALYPNHPYGKRLVGVQETVGGFTLSDVRGCVGRFLSPEKFVVAVVGGIRAEEALGRLGERLSVAPGPDRPAPVPPDQRPESKRVVRKSLDKNQAHIVLGGMGTTVFDDMRHTLEVMSVILSGQGGRLFLDLRDKQSLAYSVSSANLEGLDPGHVAVHMATSPDKVPQALEGLYGHLQALREEPVSTSELERAQRYLAGTHAIDLQRAGSRAMLMALWERFGADYDDYAHYCERINAVTAAKIQEAARHYLDEQHLVEVVVGPNRQLG